MAVPEPRLSAFESRPAGGYTRLQGGRWSDSRALSCVERFDTFNQYWTTVSSIHQARSGLGVAVLEGMIYVVGGETPPPEVRPASGQTDSLLFLQGRRIP